jgi:hypothetical protein
MPLLEIPVIQRKEMPSTVIRRAMPSANFLAGMLRFIAPLHFVVA